MEKLLQWAVNHSDNSALHDQAEAIRRGEAKPDPSRYDPKVIEAILGKDDATRMKEAVECISNPEDTVENKVIALDNLELLIEGIDNARNIENMNLWPAIIKQLSASDPKVRLGTAWVCGTAVQNNTQAQDAFMRHGGLKPMLDLLQNDHDDGVRSKALYAISGFLKHNAVGVKEFERLDGFDIFEKTLKSDKTHAALMRKLVFLFNSMIIDNASLADKFMKNNTLEELDKVLVKYTSIEEDEDLVEKVLRTIHSIVQNSQHTLSPELKKHCAEAKDKFGADNLNLTASEWNNLV